MVFCIPGEIGALVNWGTGVQAISLPLCASARRLASSVCWIRVEIGMRPELIGSSVTFSAVCGVAVDMFEYDVRDGIARPLGSWFLASVMGGGGGAQ